MFFHFRKFRCGGFFLAAFAGAQDTQPPAAPSASSPSQTSSPQVQGYTLTPDQEAKAIAYAHARHELYFLDAAYGLLLLVMILQLRIAPLYRDWAAQWTDSDFGQIIVFAPLLFLTIDVLSLPIGIWAHRLALQYQQSIQGWNSWLSDWAKGEGVELAIVLLDGLDLVRGDSQEPAKMVVLVLDCSGAADHSGRNHRAGDSRAAIF